MEAIQDLAEFGKMLAAAGIVVGAAIYYLRRSEERRGGLSDRDRELIEKMSAASIDHGERISRLEGRLNGRG